MVSIFGLIVLYLVYSLGKCVGEENIKKAYSDYDMLDVYDVILSDSGNVTTVIDKTDKEITLSTQRPNSPPWECKVQILTVEQFKKRGYKRNIKR